MIEKQERPKPGAENRFTFSRTALDSVPAPKKGRAVYYDDVVRSLVLRAHPSGAKSFMIYRKVRGRPMRIALGMFDPKMSDTHELERDKNPLSLFGNNAALNVRKARKLATAVNASLDAGVNPSAEKRKQRQIETAELTLGDLFERYHKDHLIGDGKKRPEDVVWYFERYLGALPDGPTKKHGQKRTKAKGSVNWQDRRLSTIQSEDVGRLRAALAKNISPTTANRVMELVEALFNFGKEKKLCEGDNPAEQFEKFKLQSRDRRIEAHEARKFFEKLNLESDDDFKDYVYLSICTGARRENVLQMRWDDLSLEGERWRVPGEETKNGDPVVIPLVEKAVQILRRRRAANDAHSSWVFPGNTESGHHGPFRWQWEQLREKANVPDLRIHDLRRTLGSWMSSTGASTVVTMQALGHKTVDASLVYQRLNLAPVKEAVATGIRALLKAAEPEEVKGEPRAAKKRKASRQVSG